MVVNESGPGRRLASTENPRIERRFEGWSVGSGDTAGEESLHSLPH